MKRIPVLLGTGLLLAACATPEQTERHRSTCLSYGYEAGSPELAECVEKKSRSGEAAASRVGTSLLTNAILGAI